MTRFIAFLRAINVGGRTVRMEELRRLFEAEGFHEVETIIASGNVAFLATTKGARALEARIGKRLAGALGYEVPTFLRTPAELAALARHRAFPDDERKRAAAYNVGFLAAAPPAAARARLSALATDSDRLHLNGRELYWLCRTRQSDSKVNGNVLEKALGGPVTLRGIKTIDRIVVRYPVRAD